ARSTSGSVPRAQRPRDHRALRVARAAHRHAPLRGHARHAGSAEARRVPDAGRGADAHRGDFAARAGASRFDAGRRRAATARGRPPGALGLRLGGPRRAARASPRGRAKPRAREADAEEAGEGALVPRPAALMRAQSSSRPWFAVATAAALVALANDARAD